jgi:hypothetical protein
MTGIDSRVDGVARHPAFVERAVFGGGLDAVDLVGAIRDGGRPVRRAVCSIASVTPAGRMAADVAQFLESVAAKHLHPASLELHATLDGLQLQADVHQAGLERHHQALAEREEAQLEAGG